MIQRQSIRLTHRTNFHRNQWFAIKLFRTKDLFDADQLSNETELNFFFFYEFDARTKSNQIELLISNKAIYGECFHYSAVVFNNAFGCFYAPIINANQLRNNRRTYFTLLIYFLRHFLTYKWCLLFLSSKAPSGNPEPHLTSFLVMEFLWLFLPYTLS